jgi:hypothetical protein
VLAPATLAALPSTRAIPNRDVFYVAEPISSILFLFGVQMHPRPFLKKIDVSKLRLAVSVERIKGKGTLVSAAAKSGLTCE